MAHEGTAALDALAREERLATEARWTTARAAAQGVEHLAREQRDEALRERARLAGVSGRSVPELSVAPAAYIGAAIVVALAEGVFLRSALDAVLRLPVLDGSLVAVGLSVGVVVLSTRAGRALRQWRHSDWPARLLGLAAMMGVVLLAALFALLRERAMSARGLTGAGWPLGVLSLGTALAGATLAFLSEDAVPGFRLACARAARAVARWHRHAVRLAAVEQARLVALEQHEAEAALRRSLYERAFITARARMRRPEPSSTARAMRRAA